MKKLLQRVYVVHSSKNNNNGIIQQAFSSSSSSSEVGSTTSFTKYLNSNNTIINKRITKYNPNSFSLLSNINNNNNQNKYFYHSHLTLFSSSSKTSTIGNETNVKETITEPTATTTTTIEEEETTKKKSSKSSSKSNNNNNNKNNKNNNTLIKPNIPNILLIDGTPLVVRAYHGTPPLSNSEGLPTNAIFTYTKTLLNLLFDTTTSKNNGKNNEPYKYDYIGVFFDSGKPSFRKKMDSNYKAQRKPTDDALKKQFPLAKEITEKVFGLKVISRESYEADDLIATFTNMVKNKFGANNNNSGDNNNNNNGEYNVVIVSSDKDLYCLINDQIKLFDPMTKKEILKTDIIDKFNVTPELFPSYLSLIGDTSDNIPGVKGIGKKKAIQLLESYGSLEKIIQNRELIEDKKVKKCINEGMDDLLLSMKLVELEKQVPIEVDLNYIKVNNNVDNNWLIQHFIKNQEELFNLMDKFEFSSISKTIKKIIQDHTTNGNSTSISSNSSGVNNNNGEESEETTTTKKKKKKADLAQLKEQFLKSLDLENPLLKRGLEGEYKPLVSLEDVDEFLEKVKEAGHVSIHTYLHVPQMHENILAGMVFSIEPKVAYYVRFTENENITFLQSINEYNNDLKIRKLKAMLEDNTILKIGHDMKRHIKNLAPYGISINNFDDIMVMSYVLNCGKHHSSEFDDLVQFILNMDPKSDLVSEREVLGIGKKKLTVITTDYRKLEQYICQYADFTTRIYNILKKQLLNIPSLNNFYKTLELPLVEALAAIEIHGIAIDRETLERMRDEYKEKIRETANKIRIAAGYEPIDNIIIPTTSDSSGTGEEDGLTTSNNNDNDESTVTTSTAKDTTKGNNTTTNEEEFNVNSNRQLGIVIFEKLGIKTKGIKKSKNGDYAMDATILENLSKEGHEIAKYILEYRALTKLYSTYIYGLIQHINPYTGRIHTTFQNALTVTGRLSSVAPNIQNIPVRTKEGKQIRRCFIAPDDNHVIMKVDYSQVELRILANIAKIESLQEAFANGEDIHTKTASQVFGIPIDKVDKQTRNRAKAINFGIIYGMSEYGLSKRIGVSVEEAKDFIKKYFKQYPGIKTYMDNTINFCRKYGFVNTHFKRRCWIPDINAKDSKRGFAERTSINTPIQGSSADVTKRAMVALYRFIKENNLKSRMIIQVHDEIVFEIPLDELELMKVEVPRIMEAAGDDIPLTVDATIDKRWLADE
ncbi:hypothetical protein ABK040_010218 [Willaertia magna]